MINTELFIYMLVGLFYNSEKQVEGNNLVYAEQVLRMSYHHQKNNNMLLMTHTKQKKKKLIYLIDGSAKLVQNPSRIQFVYLSP